MVLPFPNRAEAGQWLAAQLKKYEQTPNVLVLALPRGGVPVGFQIAQALHAPLDVFVVRKLGVPGQEELALGAIASGGIRVLNQGVIEDLGISTNEIDRIAARETAILEQRERSYREDRPAFPIAGKIVILTDDGLATGASMMAAVKAIRKQNPERLVVAVPVAAPRVRDTFRAEVDDVVCAATPYPFLGVGQWYEDFSQVPDEEVQTLLERAAAPILTESK